MKNFLKNYWPWIITWLLLLILIGCNIWLIKHQPKLFENKNVFYDYKSSGSSSSKNPPNFLGGGGKTDWQPPKKNMNSQKADEPLNKKQERIREYLIEILEKNLNEGKWFHCETTFKTKEEFIKHWKKCPNMPVFLMKYWRANYKETFCDKCSLVDEVILNGQTIYQHKCSE